MAAVPIAAPIPEIIISLSVSTSKGSSVNVCGKEKWQSKIIEMKVYELALKKIISQDNIDKLNAFAL
jgi:hypothetical protein